jgi:predicted Zn-dependent protease
MRKFFPKSSVSLPVLLVASCCLLGPLHAHPGIDEQIADVEKLIAATPADATLYLRRGELLRIHRDWSGAEADYRHALKLDPELIIVQQCLGKLMLDSDRASDAIKPLETYLAKRSNDTRTLALLSRAYMKLGNYAKAAEGYTRTLASITDGKPRPEYFLERSRALIAAGPKNIDAALAGLDEGLRALDHPVTLQLYAIELEIDHLRYDAALARLDQIASRSARQETWLVRRGEILEKAGRYEEARQAYQKTLDAIASLPESRTKNRAVERLLAQATAGIERLDARLAGDEAGAGLD